MDSYNLFLDDYRFPRDAFIHTRDSAYLNVSWEIVRNYDEFINFIEKNFKENNIFPKLISFDHDLDDEHYTYNQNIPYDTYQHKTGYDCALWLINFCKEKRLNFPDHKFHTLNYVGKDNIIKAIKANF